MPLMVVCLVPAAPVLLPWLTGSRVPEVAPVRAAVRRAVESLTGLDRVVVVTEDEPGTLAGFGATTIAGLAALAQPAAATPAQEAAGVTAPSWPRELADALLDRALLDGPLLDGEVAAEAVVAREHRGWDGTTTALLPELDGAPERTGLLLLADGSRTRGPRAPGGQDPRGDAVDAELVRALQQGRPADAPDAAAVGATAVGAVSLLAAAPGGATELLHQEAPLGVCYLVAVRRRGDT